MTETINNIIDKIIDGFRSSIGAGIEGIASSAILSAFSSNKWILILEIIIMIGSIGAVFSMESWGFGYSTGWLCGQWLMYSYGFGELLLSILYTVLWISILIYKTKK